MQLLIFRAACDCRSLCKALFQRPGKVAACRQLPGFPEPEDSHLSVTRPPLLTGPGGFIVPPVGRQQQGWRQSGPTHAASASWGCGRMRSTLPRIWLRLPPHHHPQPWPPRLQPWPAGRLRRCCHLVCCTPSLLRQPGAGARSPAAGGGHLPRCTPAPFPLRAEPWCRGGRRASRFGLLSLYAPMPHLHPK